MIPRLLKGPPRKSVFLFGPRGTGKSTWIRSVFDVGDDGEERGGEEKARKKGRGKKGQRGREGRTEGRTQHGHKKREQALYYDLLDTAEALRLSRHPGVLFEELAHLEPERWVVIDEIQKVPALLDEVHRLIENRKLCFLLSGSSARKLRSGGFNLLAGRAQVLNMYPFVSGEVDYRLSFSDRLRFGMLPSAYLEERPESFLRSYADTYLVEEIKAEALARDIGAFSRFLEVAARQNSQVTNVSSIARDAQVARQTVQEYFNILVDTLVGFWLPPWKLKRATKQVAHPKFYFFDSGVARALSGRLPYSPLPEESGALFETFVLNEMRAFLSYSDLHYPLYFWSSHDRVEVDVLLETNRDFLAVELKSSDRWDRRFNRGLLRISDELGPGKVRAMGVYLGKRALRSADVEVMPCIQFLKRLWQGDIIEG